MEPSEAYSPFIEQMKVKVHMSKIVIEFLTNNPDATYEDLLNKIQVLIVTVMDKLLVYIYRSHL